MDRYCDFITFSTVYCNIRTKVGSKCKTVCNGNPLIFENISVSSGS